MKINKKDIKMKRYKWLSSEKGLQKNIPITTYYSKLTLTLYMDKFRKVMIKPIFGSGGNGIFKVSLLKNDKYEIHYGPNKIILTSWSEVLELVEKQFKPRKYMVQQYIPLATINKRPFDIRVMVQRKENEDWRVTGIIAKVAGPNYTITNVRRSRGYVASIEEAIVASNLRNISYDSINRSVQDLSIKVTKKLSEIYPNHKVWGLDVGIDNKGNLWILEANSKPNISLFRKLKSKDMYREIKSYPLRNPSKDYLHFSFEKNNNKN